MSPVYDTAVFDLDNTFYDWVAVFAATTTCFIESLSAESGIATPVLESEVRAAFAAAGSLEHTYLIQDLPSLQRLHPHDSPMQLVERYADTIEAVKAARKAALTPYPGVAEGLNLLHAKGVKLAALTSAPRFAATQRLRVLGLTEKFDLLAASPEAEVPGHTDISALRAHPDSHYASAANEFNTGSLKKPDPHLLRALVTALGTSPENAVMVGDDVRQDLGMAHEAGIDAIWAKYGIDHDPADREVLVSFTHWSAADVAKHYQLTPQDAGFRVLGCADSFPQIVDLILR